MKFDTKDIKARAKENFEKTWLETEKLLPKTGGKDYTSGKGRPHALHELAAEARGIFLSSGFDEVENSIFVPEEEVYWQYGPEAPVILDRCYYLAGLPRPDIGLSNEKIEKIRSINEQVDIEKLKEIFRQYREGAIEGDNLFEDMVSRLGINTEDAARIVEVFPEFRNLSAVAEKTTLRSHMTAAWFPTLKALAHKKEMPIRLFSIGLRFRREQKVDATHLRAHYGASCVIMDPEINIEDGKKASEKILEKMGFKNIDYTIKKATSNYYAPKSEYEIFSENIEVADCGMYSPIALANYGIEYPVFNIGFGLERILMLRKKLADVREILYPQFYKELALTDKEIADNVSIHKRPETEDGRTLAEKIIKVSREKADTPSPCRFLAYKGDFLGKKIEVYVLEKETGTKLMGPAALNGIYVHSGAVYGLPEDSSRFKANLVEVKEKGVRIAFGFLEAVSEYFAYEIEKAVKEGSKQGSYHVKMAKTPGDVNITLSDSARRFIMSNNKSISIKGPVFASVEFSAQ